MRPSCLGAVSLLLLFIFLSSKVQGIRLEKNFKSAADQHPKLHEGGGMVNTRNGGVMKGDDEEAMNIVCKEQCSGKSRKLFTATTSTTPKSTTTSKSKENGDHDETKANPTSKEKATAVGSSSQQQEDEVHDHDHDHDQYADIMDIAEMDYSPAKRKPPIHN